MKAYLANGLFSLGDRLVNEQLAAAIREAVPDIALYVRRRMMPSMINRLTRIV
ncbi:hypothetical protein Bsph_3251 [Lysinibacillus sphaericus C3-41]|uniref:Uncharacterized protein n=1 Tax=Lysinibacillus sphaericus (strain C3-41) TaxID=444177 RepID=B1HQL9_LYSSC|nr:hypothetical protein [Lysinibacillus sphaericus]ACA40756.1 hypothetical protein Bsph_3251 [Lysinibacillus sphaericus C3-41]